MSNSDDDDDEQDKLTQISYQILDEIIHKCVDDLKSEAILALKRIDALKKNTDNVDIVNSPLIKHDENND